MKPVALSLFFLLYCGCLDDKGVEPGVPTGGMTDAEYAVLAAIVDSVIVGPSDSLLVLQDSTDPGIFEYDLDSALTKLLVQLRQDIPALEAATTEDFKAKNLVHTYIESPTKVHSTCVRSSSSSRIFPSLDVSRVGFNTNGQQALAYVGHSGAPLAGAGLYYVLTRQSGRWLIIRSYLVWIS